ncbi:MAG: hypothetical protein QOE37_433 [Microbacteriaceae bacterium]|nr:hypothetical protein [Microbacteriaceae bacterium]
MTRPADGEGRRSARRPLVVGVLLCVPRLVLAWFLTPPALDPLQLALSFLLIAGLITIGVGLFRFLLAVRGDRTLWPLGLGGAAAVLVAGLLTPLLQPSTVAFAYSGGPFVPPHVVLYQYAWTLVGALWVIGLVFALGAALLGLMRRRAARA